MADIRVQVPDEFMTSMKERLKAVGVTSYAGVIQEALTLLNWALGERDRGRLILSTGTDGNDVERLAMRSLAVIPPK